MISVRRDGVLIDFMDLAATYPVGDGQTFNADWADLGRIIRRLALARNRARAEEAATHEKRMAEWRAQDQAKSAVPA